jgi:hypothetical protein
VTNGMRRLRLDFLNECPERLLAGLIPAAGD